MSLQVWLPLNGTMENLGLATLPSTSYKDFTTQTDGKIGSCMKGTGAIYHLTSDFLGNTWSLACWVKSTGWVQYNDVLICKNSDTSTACNFYFSIVNGNIFAIGVNAGAQSHINYSYTFATNTWYHCAATFDGSVVKLYLNGEFKAQANVGSSYISNLANLCIGNRSTQAAGTAQTGGSSAKSFNDVRIYDHCLSAKEVKEISKGLVLHYKLDDPYIEGTTNLGATSATYSNQTEGNAYTASAWGGDAGTVTYYYSGGYGNGPYKVYHKTATGSGGIYRKTNNDITIVSGKTYTMSVYIKASRNFTDSAYSFNINGVAGSDTNHYINFGQNVTFTTEWKRISRTFTATDSDAGTYGEMSIIYDDNATDYYVYYSCFQIEEKDHATPWVDNARNNNTIIYDTSGYSNDGIASTNLTVLNSSPRYSNSTYLASAAIIAHTRCLSNTDQEWTCAAWVKPDATGGYQNLNDFNHHNYIYYSTCPILYLNSGTNDYYNYGNLALPAGQWSHIVFVFKNSTGTKLIYVNGVEHTNKNGPNKTSTPSGIPDTVAIGGTYAGYMSDYREYATALSAADVKELYDTSASIDKSGNVYAREVKEI